MVRKSPASRGYVAEGTIEKGEDGNYWERRVYGTKGNLKWFKVSDYENRRLKNEESERVQTEAKQATINLKRKIKAQEKKNKRKDEKEKKADEKEKKARQEQASRVRLF